MPPHCRSAEGFEPYHELLSRALDEEWVAWCHGGAVAEPTPRPLGSVRELMARTTAGDAEGAAALQEYQALVGWEVAFRGEEE